MCFFTPSVKLYEISKLELWNKLEAEFRWKSIKLDDNKYFYVCWEDWDKILMNVQSSLPSYKEDKFDCDNFADLIKVRVAERFEVNVCARVDGNTYLGRHAWNMFFDGDTFHQLESQQKGAVFERDDPRYTPDEIIMG